MTATTRDAATSKNSHGFTRRWALQFLGLGHGHMVSFIWGAGTVQYTDVGPHSDYSPSLTKSSVSVIHGDFFWCDKSCDSLVKNSLLHELLRAF